MSSCQTCGSAAEFGYKTASGTEWYCDKHKPAQHYADDRLPKLEKSKDWKAHQAKICATFQKATASIIETGNALLEAKAELDHGSFEAMVQRELPFDASTAQRLMKIARNPVLSKPAHVQLLPPSWGTLYELTKLPEAILRAKIEDHTITPKMERKEAVALRVPEAKPKPKPSLTRDPEGFPVGGYGGRERATADTKRMFLSACKAAIEAADTYVDRKGPADKEVCGEVIKVIAAWMHLAAKLGILVKKKGKTPEPRGTDCASVA